MLITERSESKQDVLQDPEIIYLKYTFLKAIYDTWLIISNQSNQFPRDVETSTQKNCVFFHDLVDVFFVSLINSLSEPQRPPLSPYPTTSLKSKFQFVTCFSFISTLKLYSSYYSPKWRWLAVDTKRATSAEVNIHHKPLTQWLTVVLAYTKTVR